MKDLSITIILNSKFGLKAGFSLFRNDS